MEVGMAAMKTFANPGIDIVKTLPEGIVELSLRGVAIVSKAMTLKYNFNSKQKSSIKWTDVVLGNCPRIKTPNYAIVLSDIPPW